MFRDSAGTRVFLLSDFISDESLNRGPIDTPAKIKSARQFGALSPTHWQPLSHIYCNAFNKKIADISTIGIRWKVRIG